MTWEYTRAANGNVALTGEIDLRACGGEFVLAVGFGRDAPRRATAPAPACSRASTPPWPSMSAAGKTGRAPSCRLDRAQPRTRATSTASAPRSYGIHEAKDFPGGIIASLSIPWGFDKGDDDLGGYHLVWPRDLVETAGGFLAAGQLDDARLRSALPARHPGGRRALAAEHVAERRPVLARRADGRNGLADLAGGPGPARGRSSRATLSACGRWCARRPASSSATAP